MARSLNNLAMLNDDQGEYGAAELLYQQALAIDEQVFGPSHPQVATDLSDLAFLYKRQGKDAEAERHSPVPRASMGQPNRSTSRRWPLTSKFLGPTIPK